MDKWMAGHGHYLGDVVFDQVSFVPSGVPSGVPSEVSGFRRSRTPVARHAGHHHEGVCAWISLVTSSTPSSWRAAASPRWRKLTAYRAAGCMNCWPATGLRATAGCNRDRNAHTGHRRGARWLLRTRSWPCASAGGGEDTAEALRRVVGTGREGDNPGADLVDAEIGDVGVALVVEQHVLRPDSSVHHPVAVGRRTRRRRRSRTRRARRRVDAIARRCADRDAHPSSVGSP